jgi:large subunit ribosomal protein L3
MIILLGYKIGMTQFFTNFSTIDPVTIIKVGTCFISKLIFNNNFKLQKIQLSYKPLEIKKLAHSNVGYFKHKNLLPLKIVKEYKLSKIQNYKIGQIINIHSFKENQFINISSSSNGKGFLGVHQRYKFNKGLMTHGSKNHKKPGSIGQGTTPGRVFKGKKLAGHSGNKKQTIKNLKILKIDFKENLLFIKGSICGKIGNVLELKTI